MPVNEWGERIPEPGAAFTSRRVSPANLAIEARRQNSQLLGKRELKHLSKRRDKIYAALKATGFFAALQQYKALMQHYRNLGDALSGAVNGQREPLEDERRAVYGELLALQSAHRAQVELHREYLRIIARIDSHLYAVERAEYDRRVNEALAKEAEHYAERIITRWSALGYKWDTMVRNKHHVDLVKFDAIHVAGDAIWFRISTGKKTFAGFKSTLPNRVKVADLTSEETLKELSISCQAQVTASVSFKGAWIKVNRLDTVDGLLVKVGYEQVMHHYPESDRPFLPVPMGVGEGRVISWVPIVNYPHILIGGTTGSGKSNIENVILSTLISKHGPDELQLVLIDLKEGLEFMAYEHIPHLIMPVVTTIDDAAKVLLQLEALRAERGLLLAQARVKNIDEYNLIAEAQNKRRLPRVIVLFDEFAAIDNPFMKDQQKSILASVIQMTNKARAAGIHLILCTQRPSVDVVPGHIKDNMAFRMAGPMPTTSGSITILGVGDAANLPLIPGRMMAMAGSLKWQLQTPLIEPQHIAQAVKQAMTYAERTMSEEPEKVALPEATGSLGFGEDDLIAMVMEDYNRRLVLKSLWEQLKDTGLISWGELKKLANAVKEAGEFEYEGQRYRWKRQPGGHWEALPVEAEEVAEEDAVGQVDD